MDVKKLAKILGAVLVIVGVLGFVPGIVSNGLLLGIFAVDLVHNVIHLLTGIVALGAAMSSEKHARLFFKVFGVVYALVAVIGLVQGGSVLGLFVTNMADHLLHIVLALVFLYVGFGMKGGMMKTGM